MHNGGWIVLRQDGPHQHILYKVLAGHQYMEAVPAVLNTCFQDRKGQHDLMEILIPHNSLLHCSEGIFGAGKKDKKRMDLGIETSSPAQKA